ncbi:MAG TPA: hypothetical protein PLU17_00715, partial [Chitinophagaceae bacterium]|nr:hypothetical protein [Chitinophagaceae bacterium]
MTKHYISMSKLSLLIAFSLIMMGNLSKAQKQKAVETAGTQVFPWTNDQSHELKNEIVDKRSQFSKHYQLANGNQRMYSSIGSIHYKNGNSWSEISKEIKSNTTSTHTSNPYYNGTNSFKTYYPQNPFSGKVYTSLHEGEMNENIESVYAIDQNGNIVYQFQANSTQEISLENGSIVYNNVFPSTSIRYSQGSDGRKFDIVLQNQQSLNNIPTNAAYLVIKEKVTIPSGWSVKSSSNGIDIYKGSNWLANLPTPIAFEQESANKTYENETEAMTKGEMTMSKNGNEITLYTKFSMDWLKSSTRSFPIFLDPTLTIYPLLTAMNTGYMLNVPGLPLPSPAAPKFSGNIRITAGGTVAWCKFPLTTLPANAAITSASYNGYHYNGVVPAGLPFKYASIIGMQNVDPVTADSFSIHTKIT